MSSEFGPLFDRIEDASHAAKAKEWMDAHPEAMEVFESLALQAAHKGRRFGIGALAERVRWEFHVVRGDDTYKINNNHRAYIVRELIQRHPKLAAFVELRSVNSAA